MCDRFTSVPSGCGMAFLRSWHNVDVVPILEYYPVLYVWLSALCRLGRIQLHGLYMAMPTHPPVYICIKRHVCYIHISTSSFLRRNSVTLIDLNDDGSGSIHHLKGLSCTIHCVSVLPLLCAITIPPPPSFDPTDTCHSAWRERRCKRLLH